ncbi:MAG: patatin-like protein [Kordiimonadaceae bacterium]|jgi:patatin-related protein|nr:patatin-like protein [Kordiimonadaceae bacterium]
MREKELRLALVCFGGVSLAIYMHGVSKEILKLARASKAIHVSPDLTHTSRHTYTYPNKNVTDIPDTELVYFEILKSFSPELDLRVIVDTIAGASAGGMNSVFLGRAIAHDLNFDHLRHHWLIEADVSKLTGNRKKASRWDKMISKPLISLLSGKFLGSGSLSAKVKEKLPALLNVWNLKPPFDGKHILKLVYGGLKAMGELNEHSLLPRGHRLELFVTLTDFYGYKRTILLNDPPIISEMEHRHNLKFSYFKKPIDSMNTDITSDFDDDGLPALSFAARATSCFPGAFPPAQLRETDHFLKERNLSWPAKEDFIKNNFKEYNHSGLNPELTSFLDGSILNNKPFDQAIDAIHDRPAFREVSRRVIYIDPNPERMRLRPTGAPPAMLNTLKGAMSDIPMNEPMHDDLEDIHIHNQQVLTIKDVVQSVRPSVQKLVYDVSPKKLKKVTAPEELADWRNLASARAVTEAGYSYEAYARLKIRGTIADLTKILAEICDIAPRSKEKRRIFSFLQCWILKDTLGESLLYGNFKDDSNNGLFNWTKSFIGKTQTMQTIPFWTSFIINFDINYQKRRLQFLIQELNTQYTDHADQVHELDSCKMSLYHILADIKDISIMDRLTEHNKSQISSLISKIAALPIDDDISCENNISLVENHTADIDNILAMLSPIIGLDDIRDQTDALMSKQLNNNWDDEFKQNLVTSYLGFAFWDVITFSIMGSKAVGEFNEILVNRISPNDELILKSDPLEMPLKGTAMRSFGAFFSREDRENDYLWGRLNGAERLIDLLYKQATSEGLDHKIDVIEIKKMAFRSILSAEKDHLETVPELFDKISARIDKL